MTIQARPVRAAELPQTPRPDAAAVATPQHDAILAQLRELEEAEWALATDCVGWTVRDIAAHVVGAMDEAAHLRVLLRHLLAARRGGRPSKVDGLNDAQIVDRRSMPLNRLLDDLERLRTALRADLLEQVVSWSGAVAGSRGHEALQAGPPHATASAPPNATLAHDAPHAPRPLGAPIPTPSNRQQPRPSSRPQVPSMTISHARRPAFRQLLTIGGAVLLCAVLASCSGSSKTSAPTGTSSTPVTSTPAETTTAATSSTSAQKAASSKPCALLTQAEAERAVGHPLTAGVEYAGILCAYRSSDYSGASVDLTVGRWDSINDAVHADSPPPSPINGVGDQALSGLGLSVRKGSAGFVLLVSCPNVGSDQELAEEKALATLILPRL